MHQHQQAGADQELVGHGVQEGAEGRGLVELARQKAVGPVGGGEHHEHDRGDQVLPRRVHAFQIEHPDDQRNGDDARPGQQGGKVEEHAAIMAERHTVQCSAR